MAVLQYRTISNRTVVALAVERDTVFWDRQLKGFGVRVYPTGGKLYLAQARGPDGPGRPHKARRITVGRHPVLDAEEARRRAALIIARIKAGEDPVPLPLPAKHHGGPTVADLAGRYLEQHVAVRCKPKTQRTTRSIARRHIVPALGKLPLAAVERRHVMALHESLCETPAMANMVVATLSHMYVLAGDWELVPDDFDNPCQAIPTNPERKRERFLTDAEFTRLGQVLDEVSGNGSQISAGAVTTIRLLMLTGCRKNEIMTLPWENVDLGKAELRILDGKTGSRTVHLSPSAADVLKSLPRVPANPWVVPGAKPGTHMTDIDTAWRTIRAKAGLHDVRIHDIRHSFASRALALGEALPIIGRLLGHRQAETTARYAHLDRDSVRKSAERVAVRIAEHILYPGPDDRPLRPPHAGLHRADPLPPCPRTGRHPQPRPRQGHP